MLVGFSDDPVQVIETSSITSVILFTGRPSTKSIKYSAIANGVRKLFGGKPVWSIVTLRKFETPKVTVNLIDGNSVKWTGTRAEAIEGYNALLKAREYTNLWGYKDA